MALLIAAIKQACNLLICVLRGANGADPYVCVYGTAVLCVQTSNNASLFTAGHFGFTRHELAYMHTSRIAMMYGIPYSLCIVEPYTPGCHAAADEHHL